METVELEDIQGLVRHGYPSFTSADYLLFRIDDVAGMKAWLRELRAVPWLDSADKTQRTLFDEECGVSIAFTDSGLRRLGLDEPELATFVAEFQEGMSREHRARLLGDTGANSAMQWAWGRADQLDALHGLLMVFYKPENGSPVPEIQTIQTCPTIISQFYGVYQGTEPFGFADGISQPFVEGLTQKKPPAGVRRVKAGEFVLGYLNEFGDYPASPTVPWDPRAQGQPRDQPLPQLGGSGRADFGRNGSFLVMRELEQHVDQFNQFLSGFAPEERERAAARLVGRWKKGAPLARYNEADPGPATTRELEAENDFSYHREDRHGFRCPIGAHIRRANPRDALADEAKVMPEDAQAMADRHRILRRGRVYRGEGREGLLFLCLNANIERQFEFVQSNWCLNPQFNGLQGETDPLLGAVTGNETRSMTVQNHRLPERVGGLQQFVTVRGGAYFFVPGLRAIDYLAR